MGIRGGSSTKAGAIQFFAGAAAPSGWLVANGAVVSRATFAGLFLAIGTTYGAGDGSTTFALPNLINRSPVGAGDIYSLGAKGGSKDAVVVNHAHGVNDAGHTHSTPGQIGGFFQYSGGGGTAGIGMPLQAGGNTGQSTSGISIKAEGQNGIDANMPPFLAVLPCIKT